MNAAGQKRSLARLVSLGSTANPPCGTVPASLTETVPGGTRYLRPQRKALCLQQSNRSLCCLGAGPSAAAALLENVVHGLVVSTISKPTPARLCWQVVDDTKLAFCLSIMSRSQTSMVSILNNDDNPSFAVRPTPRLTKQNSTPSCTYPSTHHHRISVPDYRFSPYCDSLVSPRYTQPPLDPFSSHSAPHPVSAGPVEYSYNSTAASRDLYSGYGRDLSLYTHATSPNRILPTVTSPSEPLSPRTPLGGPTELAASRVNRKNKYPCPYAASHGCSATFTTSGHAARHGKKHTGEKSVHCPICNKAFTRKDNMKQHRRTHRTYSEDMTSRLDRDRERRLWTKSSDQLYSHNRSASQSLSDADEYSGPSGLNSPTEEKPYSALELRPGKPLPPSAYDDLSMRYSKPDFGRSQPASRSGSITGSLDALVIAASRGNLNSYQQ
ncbi:transcriptional regulator family: C2H2 zinc finger [Paecilomyces variotii]|nr:transcriptional regulator family: C2H2 zinc finger [Paecilomyces variotii]KAJ9226950.1 transcriptional regulator family: C2H2 zinc finger [Paecilomyces variotii]KAJ9240180.1 transcriptional regulator family: C2H2 zinc finger [Paecilomyces variotii]KAJ9250932.1 transcriptional regulator family: C2H2 zinc finger [Paecilomyces variotii]KAJ9286076.1 transcriptional regulator family: C2H2 zinc finger [Paecilomyces variotii]